MVGLQVAYFVNSGSEANDMALLMARLHTGAQPLSLPFFPDKDAPSCMMKCRCRLWQVKRCLLTPKRCFFTPSSQSSTQCLVPSCPALLEHFCCRERPPVAPVYNAILGRGAPLASLGLVAAIMTAACNRR